MNTAERKQLPTTNVYLSYAEKGRLTSLGLLCRDSVPCTYFPMSRPSYGHDMSDCFWYFLKRDASIAVTSTSCGALPSLIQRASTIPAPHPRQYTQGIHPRRDVVIFATRDSPNYRISIRREALGTAEEHPDARIARHRVLAPSPSPGTVPSDRNRARPRVSSRRSSSLHRPRKSRTSSRPTSGRTYRKLELSSTPGQSGSTPCMGSVIRGDASCSIVIDGSRRRKWRAKRMSYPPFVGPNGGR